MRIIKAETPEWMKPKKKHKPSLLIKPDPIEIGTCPLCHREITDVQKGTRLEGTDFVYENKRVLCHKECGKRKKLGNTTRQEAKIMKKKAEKKRKPYKKKK